MKNAFYIFILFFCCLANADWEAKVKIDGALKTGSTQATGQMRMKGKRMRLDLESPFAFSVIGDNASRKAWMLIHAAKLLIQTTISESDLKNIPLCDDRTVDACLAKYGYREKGKEKINGYNCTMYEANLVPPVVKSPTHASLWRVDGMKEMPITRVVTYEKGNEKHPTTVDLTEIKIGPLESSVFDVPTGYISIPNGDAFLKNMGK